MCNLKEKNIRNFVFVSHLSFFLVSSRLWWIFVECKHRPALQIPGYYDPHNISRRYSLMYCHCFFLIVCWVQALCGPG